MQRTSDDPTAGRRAVMLEAHDLTVTYGRTLALRGLSLRVPRGDIVALLGPNGAGKSSALAAIAGLIRPRGGEVLLDGFPITREPAHVIARRGIAAVPQGRDVLCSMTVAENLRLGAYWRRSDPEIVSDLDATYSRFPLLAERRFAQAGALSIGEQQQLAIARALMARPRLLLLDEPSLGLDPEAISGIFSLLSDLRQSGLTILLAEQNVFQALAIAQYGYVLERGQAALAGGAVELTADPRLKAVALGGRLPE